MVGGVRNKATTAAIAVGKPFGRKRQIHNLEFDVAAVRRQPSHGAQWRQPAKDEGMNEVYKQAMNWINSLDKQEWLLVLIGARRLGFLALRGIGSRTNY